MKTAFSIAATALVISAGSAMAHDEEALRMAPPGEPYVKVSDALPLPEYIPGLGTLFVNPEKLPAGPFLAYDHDGKLSATVYMTPLEELQNGTAYDGLGIGNHTVSNVDIYYNAGHPGVDKPHAHVVLFHDDDAKSRLAE
ncbi:hypothetical protein [Pukyongiella litopenaei]|uniref:Uncharacterized protein n=1 Tax=Pukyongiella litopenaei TaxID=2605946 RepID=A0A2S0MNW6_9RHOB|nr:hypothetical protein [Pukyongiella litopenaei]AVO37536.1 hypothetical protein C6Y53_07325 [Pukyongiella litopenaei]